MSFIFILTLLHFHFFQISLDLGQFWNDVENGYVWLDQPDLNACKSWFGQRRLLIYENMHNRSQLTLLSRTRTESLWLNFHRLSHLGCCSVKLIRWKLLSTIYFHFQHSLYSPMCLFFTAFNHHRNYLLMSWKFIYKMFDLCWGWLTDGKQETMDCSCELLTNWQAV